MVFQRDKRNDYRRLTLGFAHRRAKVFECPACSSSDTTILLRRQRPDYWFSINAPRECAVCKTVFVPQANVFLRTVTLAFGVLVAVFSLLLHLIPAIVNLASEGWVFRSFVNGVLGAVTVIFGVYVVVTAFKSGSKRVLPIDPAPPEEEEKGSGVFN